MDLSVFGQAESWLTAPATMFIARTLSDFFEMLEGKTDGKAKKAFGIASDVFGFFSLGVVRVKNKD